MFLSHYNSREMLSINLLNLIKLQHPKNSKFCKNGSSDPIDKIFNTPHQKLAIRISLHETNQDFVPKHKPQPEQKPKNFTPEFYAALNKKLGVVSSNQKEKLKEFEKISPILSHKFSWSDLPCLKSGELGGHLIQNSSQSLNPALNPQLTTQNLASPNLGSIVAENDAKIIYQNRQIADQTLNLTGPHAYPIIFNHIPPEISNFIVYFCLLSVSKNSNFQILCHGQLNISRDLLEKPVHNAFCHLFPIPKYYKLSHMPEISTFKMLPVQNSTPKFKLSFSLCLGLPVHYKLALHFNKIPLMNRSLITQDAYFREHAVKRINLVHFRDVKFLLPLATGGLVISDGFMIQLIYCK